MNLSPLVSVLVPVYNCENYIRECLDSIIRQDYKNIQLIIYNDGSTDGSFEICKEYDEEFDFIELYSGSNKGVATARNELLKHIKGDYFIFIDADDWIEPEMISFLLSIIKAYDSDIAVCDIYGRSSDELKVEDWNKDTAVREFLKHKKINGSLWNKLTKVSLLHNERFRCGISYGEDALFFWGILQRIKKITLTNRPLYHYRVNLNSISHCNFNGSKFTGDEVWSLIENETGIHWPGYLYIAQGRRGMEALYVLRQAGQWKYPYDNNIKSLMKVIRRRLPSMLQSGLLRNKEIFNAFSSSIWYGYNRLYYKLYKIKNKKINNK